MMKLDVFHLLLKIPGETSPDGTSGCSDTIRHFVALAQSEESALGLLKHSRDTFPGMSYTVKAAVVENRGPGEQVFAPAEQLYRI